MYHLSGSALSEHLRREMTRDTGEPCQRAARFQQELLAMCNVRDPDSCICLACQPLTLSYHPSTRQWNAMLAALICRYTYLSHLVPHLNRLLPQKDPKKPADQVRLNGCIEFTNGHVHLSVRHLTAAVKLALENP